MSDNQTSHPTKCSLCGCTVLHRHLVEVIHKLEVYFGGTLRDTRVTEYLAAPDCAGEWRCSSCNYKWHTSVETCADTSVVDSPSCKLTLCVEKDPKPTSPRSLESNLSSMYVLLQPCELRFAKYPVMGDSHHYTSGQFGSWDEFRKWLVQHERARYMSPLYFSDHEHAISSSCMLHTTVSNFPHSNTQIGYMFTTWARIERREISCSRVDEIMCEELKQYNHYLTGNIWRYIISAENNKELESASGFCSEEEARKAGEKMLECI